MIATNLRRSKSEAYPSWYGWRQVGLGMVILVVAVLIPVFHGNTRLALYSVLGCMTVLCGIAFMDWRAGVLILIGILTVEDLIRKYLGNNMLIYFLKDSVYLAVLLSFLLTSMTQRRWGQRRLTLHIPFLPFLAVFLAYAVVQTFNPNSPSPLYGVIGFRMNFLYLPLIWLGFHICQTPEDLGRFWTFCLLVASVVAVLGIIQGIVGLDFLNPPTLAEEIRPLAYLVREAPISGYKVPRPCSVFVSDGRFGHFMLLCLTLGLGACIALWLHPVWREWLTGWRRIALVLGTALCGVALFMVGSRGGFVFGILTVLTMVVVSHWQATVQRLRRRFRKAFLNAVLAVGITFVMVRLAAPEALKARWAFYWETLSPWSPRSELFERVFRYHPQNFWKAFSSPVALFGQGFGTNSLGIQYLRKFTNVPPPQVVVESGIGNIVAETGIIGLVLWLLWSFAAVWSAWKVVKQLRDSVFAPFAVSIGWYATVKILGPLWGGMAGFQEFIGNAFLWLLLGILFRLPYLTLSPASRVTNERHVPTASFGR
ncbi:hypothetical protein GG496_002312 [Candidatus Fervidibacteria bacterium JGI MDM2 JNZ-1-D12]